MPLFTITSRDAQTDARTGMLELAHGSVETPVFMPVGTNGSVKAIAHPTLVEMHYSVMLANTYHLYLRPGLEVIRSGGGLHRFIGWNHNILTDSGGFQVFSLANLRDVTPEGVHFRSHVDGSSHMFTPESVIDAQAIFGSDIAMPLDVCSPPEIDIAEACRGVKLTDDWLKRSVVQRELYRPEWSGELFGIVQGGFYPELRRESARRTAESELSGNAIGGLSVGEPFSQFLELLSYTAPLLPHERPRYLMGIGTPDYVLAAIERGIDMFDCVYPTRTARTGTVLTRSGPISIKKSRYASDHEPIDTECNCRACTTHSRAYLRHLFKTREILGIMLATEHNLLFLQRLLREARDAVGAGRFPEFKRQTLLSYSGGAK